MGDCCIRGIDDGKFRGFSMVERKGLARDERLFGCRFLVVLEEKRNHTLPACIRVDDGSIIENHADWKTLRAPSGL